VPNGLSDPVRLSGQWNRALPARYAVDAPLFAFNTFESGILLEDACQFGEDGFLIVKAPRFGDPEQAIVSALAYLDHASAVAALQSARRALVRLGHRSWQFGGDWRHFFPGVPDDCPTVERAVAAGGMQRTGSWCVDVERDLSEYTPPVAPASGARVCASEDRNALSAFLRDEFPGRWEADVTEKLGEEPHRVFVLEQGSKILGFAMTQMEGDRHRRAGAVWSNDLGPCWAALGPIGVAKSARGHGHGHALLAAALCALRDQGARRTVIDWTVLTEFYGRHGFVTARRYHGFAGQLAR
jgi:GNAT superfamily N-acetyltransferase